MPNASRLLAKSKLMGLLVNTLLKISLLYKKQPLVYRSFF
jgi:hypothetical protein